MPVLYISADYFSLLLLAREDVMDAFTFDPQTMLMPNYPGKISSILFLDLLVCAFNEIFLGPYSSIPDSQLLNLIQKF